MESLSAHSLQRIALDGCNALHCRSISTRMLAAIGSWGWRTCQSSENVLVSAEDVDGGYPVGGLSTNHRTRYETGAIMDSMMPGMVVALSATMKKCKALLQRMRHSLLDNMRTEIRLAGVYEALRCILDEIESGRINSTRNFSIAVQEVIGDMVEVSPSSTVRMKNHFERELLYVETPEIDCAYFNDMCLGSEEVVPVSIEVDIEVFLDQVVREQTLSRWMWVEVALVDSAGLDVDFVPRIRCEMLAKQQGDTVLGLTGLAFKAKQITHDPIRFRQKLSYSSAKSVSRKFLDALRGGSSALKVCMRVDWPILQRVQVKPGACNARLGVLKPSSE